MQIDEIGSSIPAESSQEIPPDPSNLITALRQIGYTLEQSIADLIDNSINARAQNVLVRFIHDGERISRVVIADDGCGMDRSELQEAMKFGSKQKNDGKSLGKYGMGLKVASLSYAQSLMVLTRKGSFVGGRRWTVSGISKGWRCDQLPTKAVEGLLKIRFGNVSLKASGTVLVWSDIDRITVGKNGVQKTIQNLTRKLKLHFGLCFHRFIEDGRLHIRIDDRQAGTEDSEIFQIVEPINPFEYAESGSDSFPKVYKANVPDVGPIRLDAHIWPPNSKSLNYKLGGKAAARQGLYFYRNDRLIQAGGWNGIVDNETEPHTSLARIVVNLSPDQDAQYGLNVQKSAIIVPSAFVEAVKLAKSSDGDTLNDFRAEAQKTYRKKDDRFTNSLPKVPKEGLPKRLASDVKQIITKGKGKVRNVDFEWEHLKSGGIFELDRENKKILLNKTYRKEINAGRPGSATDVPVFKLLLFLLLEDDLDTKRNSADRTEKLERINHILREAVLLERG